MSHFSWSSNSLLNWMVQQLYNFRIWKDLSRLLILRRSYTLQLNTECKLNIFHFKPTWKVFFEHTRVYIHNICHFWLILSSQISKKMYNFLQIDYHGDSHWNDDRDHLQKLLSVSADGFVTRRIWSWRSCRITLWQHL